MNDLFWERCLLVFVGISSVEHACSWIYKILNSPKPYHKRQYFNIALALLVILLGISTFFTKCTLNCLCGIYAGVSELINLHHDIVIKKNKKIWNMITDRPNGFFLGLTYIMLSLFLTFYLYVD